MPDTPAFLPLRRKAPAVAEYDLPCARRGAAVALQASTRARVGLRAPASPEPMRGGFFRERVHRAVRMRDLIRGHADSWSQGLACAAIVALLLLALLAPPSLIDLLLGRLP